MTVKYDVTFSAHCPSLQSVADITDFETIVTNCHLTNSDSSAHCFVSVRKYPFVSVFALRKKKIGTLNFYIL